MRKRQLMLDNLKDLWYAFRIILFVTVPLLVLAGVVYLVKGS